MQLKRIQLNGFKSFVDPTSIPILSNMNAIVGPNGCGKSNIVDAIRWVTGETSAKQLRGQSMSDIIFNGTTSRKPVGKASVELTFDNSDHRITGEYAAFTEISIRREVVRDGQSNYFINGVPARRRDLVDLFLGTGLGPRSYAIIEQGMISQLIEAKPEEMRTHFEEVAGISKYRERRRETENRIRHTQDNLDRLKDLQDELAKQLQHLQRQANAAEQYKILKQEQRITHAQTKALQWRQFETQLVEQKEILANAVLAQDAKSTELRECETHIEKSRVKSETFHDQKEAIQKRFYAVGADIARLEQQIAHKQEQLRQWNNELKDSDLLFAELTTQANQQMQQSERIQQEINTSKPQQSKLQNSAADAQTILQTAEHQMHTVQQQWDQFLEQAAQINQQCEIAKNNARHYESQKQELNDRRAQIQTQINAVSLAQLSDEIEPFSQKRAALKNSVTDIQQTLHELTQSITDYRRAYQESQNAVLHAQGDLQKCEAEQASLAALQKAALQDHQSDVRPWLDKQGFSEKTQLGQVLQVESGWELSIETVLGDYFDAICIDDIQGIQNTISELTAGNVTFLQTNRVESITERLSNKMVRDVIKNCAYLPNDVSSIYLANHLAEALLLVPKLQATESIVTKDGYWVGVNWLKVRKSQASEDGFLVREKKLKELKLNIDQQKIQLIDLQVLQQTAKTGLENIEAARDAKHKTFQETTASLTEVQAAFSAKQSRLESLTQQQQRLNAQLQQIELQLQQCEISLQAVNNKIVDLIKKQNEDVTLRETLSTARSEATQQLNEMRIDAQSKKRDADQWNIRLSSNENQLTVLMQSLQTNQKQLSQLTQRRNTLQLELNTADAPLTQWSAALQIALKNRVTVESELRVIDTELQAEQHELKRFESLRDASAKALSSLQEQQQQLRLQQQESVVRQTTLQEHIQEMQFELHAILNELPAEANSAEWEMLLNRLQIKIDRLGPINLAAIDEFKTLSERKTYLDQQYADLVGALEVLQDAIRKIDRETRHLFKDTFDQVNQNFQKLFPRIFNGGQSLLELTEDDLLTTGILVKAQPPGKRNSTIHMLSGGEKTLTAIALIFAMFQINPAPFCVLDEVDAPLDDLNVGRYCQLIREMSKDTQFLIISHNKVTIEAADHLMGVTMQELGISRIVSVDIQEAVAMAE